MTPRSDSHDTPTTDPAPNWPPSWAYADTAPTMAGHYRQRPEDFEVEEQLGFEPSGDGEHVWLWVEKRALTTPDLARHLARLAGIPLRDVGFSGLKDRDAVTRQWFSLGLAGRELPADWDGPLAALGARVISQVRHARKLKRGVHRANRFRLWVRVEAGGEAELERRWARLVEHGVPNYFGAQRFGPHGRNLQRAHALLAEGWRKRRDPQGLLLSSARSYLFNMALAERVADGSWQTPLAGDVLNLDGTASQFLAERIDEALRQRAATGDVHPTGPLWGRGELTTREDVAAREHAVVARFPTLQGGLEGAGLTQARRPLRVTLGEARLRREEGVARGAGQARDPSSAAPEAPPESPEAPLEEPPALWLEFTLGRGSFATAVLRELFRHPDLV